MKLLVTGASGSIGRYIVAKAMASGVDIAATSRHGEDSIACDMLDSRQRSDLLLATKPTHIISCAWVTDHPSYWSSIENLSWARATIEFHKQFIAEGGQHFMFVSSCAEYSWGEPLLVEDQSLEKPATFYGDAKLLTSRQLLRDAAEHGTKVAVARLFHPFSEYENPKRVFPYVVDKLLMGEPVHLNNADIYRDIYHAGIAADAINEISRYKANGFYNIAHGEPVHLGDFIAKAADMLKRRELLSWPVWSADVQPGHPQTLLGSGVKVKKFMPISSGLTEGLEVLIEARRKALALL